MISLLRSVRIGRFPGALRHCTSYNSVGCMIPSRLQYMKPLHSRNEFSFHLLPYTHRSFHTSKPHHLNPIVWAVVRPIAKITAALFGRGFRKWWRSLPENKRNVVKDAVGRHKWKLIGSFLILGGGFYLYYDTHLQETPITKRKRFIVFNADQMKQLTDYQHKMLIEEVQDSIMKTNRADYERVSKVALKLLRANKDINEVFEKEWTVTVIDSPIRNAFVLPNGQIFVYKGMLEVCHNEDELGVILGHEIAHSILGHGAEQINHLHLVDLVSCAIVALLWAILPSDALSLFMHWLTSNVTTILMELPYTRFLETEADDVSLQLLAKACFDVRTCSAFWSKMSKLRLSEPDIEWLSTHPDHDSRVTFFDERIPQALELRGRCNCSDLPKIDPRHTITSAPVQQQQEGLRLIV